MTPDFFIIGAPKCGTTALYHYLSAHDGIFLPSVKEPNFFCTDFDMHSDIQDAQAYGRLFEAASADQITGEASVWYLFSEVAVRNILKVNPKAKFIVMIRDPVEMFASLHAQLLYSLREDEPDMEAAWRLRDQHRTGGKLQKEPKTLRYDEVCALGAQLERFFQDVAEAQRKVIIFDDLKADPAAVYREVLAFLNLPDDGRASFPVVNERKAHRYPFLVRILRHATRLARPLKHKLRQHFPNMSSSLLKPLYDLQSRPALKTDLRPEFAAELRSFFAPEITLVETLLKRDLADWKKP